MNDLETSFQHNFCIQHPFRENFTDGQMALDNKEFGYFIILNFFYHKIWHLGIQGWNLKCGDSPQKSNEPSKPCYFCILCPFLLYLSIFETLERGIEHGCECYQPKAKMYYMCQKFWIKNTWKKNIVDMALISKT